MGFLFENLDVYHKALEFADKAINVAGSFPRGQSVLSDQLKHAALSVPLNIAEECGRCYKKDKKQFYLISRGSVYECVPLLTLLVETDSLDRNSHNELREELVIISKMLAKLISKLS